jgi:hypothetical protein
MIKQLINIKILKILKFMVFSFRIYIDIEKEYIILSIKKWYHFIEKQECIPKIDFNFYVDDCIHVIKNGTKKASNIYGFIDDSKKTKLEIEVYVENFKLYLEKTFNQEKLLLI